jgi:hypothetical protein
VIARGLRAAPGRQTPGRGQPGAIIAWRAAARTPPAPAIPVFGQEQSGSGSSLVPVEGCPVAAVLRSAGLVRMGER